MPTWLKSTAEARRRARFVLRVGMWLAALMVGTTVSALAQVTCQGPGAPATTQTKCLTAIAIPGNPLVSFDISWVNPDRGEYYLADRANAGIDIIDTTQNKFKKTITGSINTYSFVGIKLTTNSAGMVIVDNNHSGPDGVVSHGKWLYAGDGDSTLKVIDLDTGTIVASIPTGGKTRLDEMALTTDGKILIAANNAEDPPFATLFTANGDDDTNSVTLVTKITVDPAVIPSGHGLSIEQPAWDPETKRFYTSIPVIAENPAGCNYGQTPGPDPKNPNPITCSGGLLVTDPNEPNAIEGTYDPVENTGVISLNACGPNGATIGPHDNMMLGCTPGNLPGSTTTLVINARTHNYAQVGGITGSDEVWFNRGDNRYYTGSSAANKPSGSMLNKGSVLGVVDGTSVLIETIPQSSGSHSVAADSKRNLIFVPQAYTSAPMMFPLGDQNFTAGTDSMTVGQLICGTSKGCIAVYTREHSED
jgi:hypothetical protein